MQSLLPFGWASALKQTPAPMPRPAELELEVGLYQEGTLPWHGRLVPSAGKSALVLPEEVYKVQMVVVGLPGAGKTSFLMKYTAAARAHNVRCLFFDAKGDEATQAEFYAAMYAAYAAHLPPGGAPTIKLFPLDCYDGWRGGGTERQLVDLLMGLQQYSEQYYQRQAEQILPYALFCPAGPPKHSAEFLARLSYDGLRVLHADTPTFAAVARLSSNVIHEVYNRFDGFFEPVGGLLDGAFSPTGWAMEDVDAAYLRLDGGTDRTTASLLGRFLLDDLLLALKYRQAPGKQRQTLILVDDEGAIAGATELMQIFERVRYYGASGVVTGQSAQSLGDQQEMERILGAAETRVLFRVPDPQPLIRASRQRITSDQPSYSYGARGVQVNQKAAEEWIVPPDEVKQLPNLEAVLIHRGEYARLRVMPVRRRMHAEKVAEAVTKLRQAEAARQRRLRLQMSTAFAEVAQAFTAEAVRRWPPKEAKPGQRTRGGKEPKLITNVPPHLRRTIPNTSHTPPSAALAAAPRAAAGAVPDQQPPLPQMEPTPPDGPASPEPPKRRRKIG